MKRIFSAIVIMFLCSWGLNAQDLSFSESQAENQTLAALYQLQNRDFTNSAVISSTSQHYLQTPQQQMKIGQDLLIAGGCCLVAGAAIFPLAYLCISDSPGASALGGLCSIGGITLMGASVPLFIAGSIMYVKGKKNNSQMAFTGNGFVVRF